MLPSPPTITPTTTPNTANVQEQLVKIASITNNDVIIALVVIALVIVALAIPIMVLLNKRDKDKLSQYIQRDKMILDAFGRNAKATEEMTSVLSGLQSTLTATNIRCVECKSEQMRRFDTLITMHSEIKSNLAVLTDRKE